MGDIWSSVDGNTVFISAGTEPLALGGKTYNVSSVAMYEVGTLQDNGADAINQCINIGLSQDQTNDREGLMVPPPLPFLMLLVKTNLLMRNRVNSGGMALCW